MKSQPAYTDFLVETSDYYSVREQSVGVTSVGYDGHTAVRHCTAQSSPVASQSVSQLNNAGEDTTPDHTRRRGERDQHGAQVVSQAWSPLRQTDSQHLPVSCQSGPVQ